MRLCADMKWSDCSSKVRMRKHLANFVCARKSNLRRIFEGKALPAFNHVELSIKCGKVAERSYFVFLKRSRNKSRIMGVCSTNRLFDLIDDFDFLREQMNASNIEFILDDPKVTLDGNKLLEEANKKPQIKTVLAELLGMIGVVSGATAIFSGEFNQIKVLTLILGLIFWVGSVVAGNWKRPKYVLVDQN